MAARDSWSSWRRSVMHSPEDEARLAQPLQQRDGEDERQGRPRPGGRAARWWSPQSSPTVNATWRLTKGAETATGAAAAARSRAHRPARPRAPTAAITSPSRGEGVTHRRGMKGASARTTPSAV